MGKRGEVAIRATGSLAWSEMRAAIEKCASIDDCREMINRAVAFAAYYEQANDDSSLKLINQIRLRAWRRMAELIASVDFSGLVSLKAKVERVREVLDTPVVAEMSDIKLTDLVKLSTVPEKEFEIALALASRPEVSDLLHRTPSAEAERQKRWEARQRSLEYQKSLRDPDEEALESAISEDVNRLWTEVEQEVRGDVDDGGMDEPMTGEVGFTMTRRERIGMKAVVFLIKDPVHAAMRQAAFDHKLTMQEVLRRGLRLWLTQHGYKYPGDEAA